MLKVRKILRNFDIRSNEYKQGLVNYKRNYDYANNLRNEKHNFDFNLDILYTENRSIK